MKRVLRAAALAALLTFPSAAAAVEKNVALIRTLPDTEQATALNFLEYGPATDTRRVMYAVGRFGLRSYDVADPANPVALDHLTNEELKLTGDTEGTFWQNEDMDVDPRRKLVFMARDPRAFNGTPSEPDEVAGVYIVDARDPTDLKIATFVQLPTGHTTTCINGCDYLWTGGPDSNVTQQAQWPRGRPIFVTDIRDLERPFTHPTPVDTGRDDGQTAYTHDVQVDALGIAWVSGSGGTRGYRTRGEGWDPVSGEIRQATAFDPIPYAGGAFEEVAAPSKFMHNALRPIIQQRGRGAQTNLLMATEEANGTPTCEQAARFVIGSLSGSYEGEAWRSTPQNPFRLQTVSYWSPTGEEGTDPAAKFCSAHYFDISNGVLAYSWYDQGTRFVDVSDPRNPTQVAYYRPDGGVSWAPYYRYGYVWVADHGRGVEVLKLARSRRTADARAAARSSVRAPRISRRHARLVARLMKRYRPDPVMGWVCPVPRPS